MPSDYRRLAEPLGITGTVVVEASPWEKDNDWVLALTEHEPFIRGFVGNLPVGEDLFAIELKRLLLNPRFRGVRLRDANGARLGDAAVLRDLKSLASAGLSLDVNGGPGLLPAIARIARDIPDLRMIIDHVSNVRIDGEEPPRDWRAGMEEAARQPNVFCKVSGLVEGSGRKKSAPTDLDYYRPVLDHVAACFGEDRLVYGSNWPVSELFADLRTVHSIVNGYFAARGNLALRKVFSENCRKFYRPPV
jgi:L-fuconolactonase